MSGSLKNGRKRETKMYELNLINYKEFCEEAKEIMNENDIDLEVLSWLTGYSVTTLERFFSGRKSRFVAAAIADALEIKT